MRRTLLGTLVLAAAMVTLAFPSAASERPDQAEEGLTLESRTVAVPGTQADRKGTSWYLWPWSKARRGFFFEDSAGASYGKVYSVDLDTGEETGSRPLMPLAWAGTASKADYTRGMPHMASVDQSTGRLFAAYTAHHQGDQRDREFVSGKNCWSQALSVACLGGYMVIDGISLEVVKTMPLRLTTVDGVAVQTIPRALTFVPETGRPDGGKLLALVEDVTAEQASSTKQYGPRMFEMNRTFLVQFDVASGGQEWALPLEECRGTRDRGVRVGWRAQPAPAAIAHRSEGASAAIWVGCHGNGRAQALLVRVPLDNQGRPVNAAPSASGGLGSLGRVEPEAAEPSLAVPALGSGRQVFVGPENSASILADPVSGRFLVRSFQPKPPGEVWLVFDTEERNWIGSIGTGPHVAEHGGRFGLDPLSGRLFVLHDEGLYVAETRRKPLPQALFYDSFRNLEDLPAADANERFAPLVIDSHPDFQRRNVLFRKKGGQQYGVISEPADQGDTGSQPSIEGETLDVPEVPGVTAVTFDGAARGYGMRVLLLGGAEAALRLRAIDPVGTVRGGLEWARTSMVGGVPLPTLGEMGVPGKDPCADKDVEAVFGFVGPGDPATVDLGGSQGSAIPFIVDVGTAADLAAPASRCSQRDWEQLWSTALFGRPPAEEPGVRDGLPEMVSCVRQLGDQSDVVVTKGDPVLGSFASRVECGTDSGAGYSYTRLSGEGVLGSSLAQAMSSYRVYRDPARGLVARVESVARGVNLEGLVRIESVRGVAESWANGRTQPTPEAERDPGYQPNCDLERTAGTCFRRQLFGLRTPLYSCGPCGDEEAFIKGIADAFGSDANVRLRKPDQALSRGSDNGYIAAYTKSLSDRFADAVLNSDLVQSVVPTLEIIRYAPPGHPIETTDIASKRGRQIYQFAGVEVSSSYGIQCLLVYDPEKNTCSAPAELAAELKVQLTDAAEKPLAGGGFEIREDVDADGVLGLADKLIPDGACVTTDDGTGTCSFSALKPGTYLVSQVVAPPGYAPTKEPFPVELVSGESRTVVFTNTSSLSAVNITLEGEDGQPLSGGSFAIYPDPDADGKVAPDAQPAATCDTAADGTCSMTVPAGSYVLVQTAAPDGLEPIEPVPFVITSGGQVAAVEAVNYPFGTPPEAAPAAGPTFTYQPPPAELPPELHTVPLPTMGIPQDEPEAAPQESTGAAIGNTVERIVRAPGDVMRLLARSPAEAIAFAAAVLLFALACAAIDRRRKLLAFTVSS